MLCVAMAAHTMAEELEDARKLLLSGRYEECLQACEKRSGSYRDEDWQLLRAETLLVVGRYPDAEGVVSNALLRHSDSVRLRVLGFETANSVGATNRAAIRLEQINQLVASRVWAYRDPPNLVALGRAALLLGADARTVLERFFNSAQKEDPSLRDVFRASGELALEKHDYALAAKTYSEAMKKFPHDPDFLHGLARAYAPNARGRMLELLNAALARNERHVPSLLLLADHQIDAEQYTESEQLLQRARRVNPWHPEAWAYQAVLAHLRNDPDGEQSARFRALQFWKTNPRVDHLIGLKLSQKYRFAEGAASQRRALAFDPAFTPARIQLAEDLLRLGEDEGWVLAEEVHRRDGYDVTAFNLVTLHGTMAKFQTLTNADFIVRMSPHEAALYGDRALALLQRAKDRLSGKYGIELESPTIIEIFPDQKDFGVRTFGLPHNPGFLGVCFGRVVTANSPASQGGQPSNWEAVLWHEFAHVITLQLTRNKMPRWLSEGISVYEELQANPAWGQRMNPQYREMILGSDLVPVSDLSAAFLSPKSELHVQFAYFQSALVVEFLIERFGFENLAAILRDLGDGVTINDAIPKHTAPMPEIERGFAAFAKGRAEALGPGLEWEKPRPIRLSRSGPPRARVPTDFEREYGLEPAPPKSEEPPPAVEVRSDLPNYWTLLEQARKALAEKEWDAAKTALKNLIELCPDQSGPANAYALLAAAHRGRGDIHAELAALEKWAASDADALDAYARLMELAERERDWQTVAQNAERFLAVNPLLPLPYRFLARASEELGNARQAVTAYRKILLLDPADPAAAHFRLATLLHRENDPAARRHVLQALEEAPRFREAHRLLLELTGRELP